jgi:5'-nucleotidase (lipoprotein e(P4) family)
MAVATLMRLLTLVIALVFAFGCTRPALEGDASVNQAAPVPEKLFGTLWVQTALEHRVIVEQTYNLAALRLDEALADPGWTAALEQKDGYRQLKPAVILDVDETVLDNSAFQARLVEAGLDFNQPMWDAWLREARAPALPGAGAFVHHALQKGVQVFFVTNRDAAYEDVTVENLRTTVFPAADAGRVLCRNERPDWGADKTSRRRYLADRYRILLLIGDDFNDFTYLGRRTPAERMGAGKQFHDQFGVRWIQLPNVLYGSWENALYGYRRGLTAGERQAMQYELLRTQP